MSIKKDLSMQLKKVQRELTLPHLPIATIEKLSLETKKNFDEAIKQLMIRRDLLKKIDFNHNYLKLWKHRGQPIVLPINWRYILSAPFIYGMIFPAVIWHLCLEIYHQICFRLYDIPRVKTSEYFLYDRQLLSCLNVWEKINCYYCSYVNNLVRYSAEIGGRTERYWCPIKYARRIGKSHSQYAKFIATNNEQVLRQKWGKLRDFSDISSK